MSNELRDKIRSIALGSKKNFKTKTVKFNGVEIEVKQLTLGERSEYTMSCIDNKTQQADVLKLQVYAIIKSCYVPNTDTKIFEDTDYEMLCNDVTGGLADQLWNAIQELSNITLDDAKKN
jgi:hypothetical protein